MDKYFIVGIFALLIILFLTKMNFLEKEFRKLLNIVGTLKFKQFEHETQLLNRAGVYVPEDSAKFVYDIVWSMIEEKDKEFLESEYKHKCPSHIPMWKFVLYNYKLSTSIVQKEPFREMSRAEEILSSMYEVDQVVTTYKNTIDELGEKATKIQEGFDEVVSKLDKIEDEESIVE